LTLQILSSLYFIEHLFGFNIYFNLGPFVISGLSCDYSEKGLTDTENTSNMVAQVKILFVLFYEKMTGPQA